ncbi:hypothetical protein D0N50_20345 [Erwinia billingiae]|uniref:hypothetical protein n=1 Tax=Erwinia billingiae TaxID=182337 RepID=UPI0012455B9D|nr:hypothetical protein [Erwinia billingiae]QEW33883.1 hypothetical protein D0N50_20345 [Erwinia billingiae]
MKSSNIIFAALLVSSGCAGRPDYTLTPPASTEWVKVTVKLPSQIKVIPLDVLYRSEKCQREDYDSVSESHIRQERGYNPQVVRMESGQEKYLWEKVLPLMVVADANGNLVLLELG